MLLTPLFNLCPGLSSHPLGQNNSFELNVLISMGPASISVPFSRRKRRAERVKTSPKELHDDERHAEMFRRFGKDDGIERLPEDQQAQATAKEGRKRQEYEALHVTCIYCNPRGIR
jgi:hypothetical protein